MLCFGIDQNAEFTDQEYPQAFLAHTFVRMMMMLASTFAQFLTASVVWAQLAAKISNILLLSCWSSAVIYNGNDTVLNIDCLPEHLLVQTVYLVLSVQVTS